MIPLTPLLDSLVNGHHPTNDELCLLLTRRGPELDAVCAAARDVRRKVFGTGIALYGFIYLSTYCRNNCAFCLYRSDNTELTRYRKTPEEILAVGERLARDGVHLLDLTLGEDPAYLTRAGMAELSAVVRELKTRTDCAVMVSPGLLDAAQLEMLAAAGADWYACYQETHNPELFQRLRLEQDFAARMRARRQAAHAGLHAEDGLLVGAGASVAQLADAVLSMAREPLRQVRAMRYVPHPLTLPPVGSVSGRAHDAADEPAQELALMAALRLTMPERLIPASLDVDGLEGLAARLNAGANVVTSIIPAGEGLAGVASQVLDIDNDRRSVAAVCAQLERLGLEPLSRAAAQRLLRAPGSPERERLCA